MRGFTLLELALAISVGAMIAGMGLMLFNQQLAFMRIFRAQDFLSREAPMINNYLIRVIGSAEGYQLHADMASLRAGQPAVLTNAKVLVLRFREANDTMKGAILSFEDPGTGSGLYYTVLKSDGSFGTPDWALSKQPSMVSFAIEQGILRIYLDGPNGERLVYSGAEQL